jgi:hypothetical protein
LRRRAPATHRVSLIDCGGGRAHSLLDEEKAKSMTTTTAKDDIYAFIFGQEGLMAGLGVQGNKITKINPK